MEKICNTTEVYTKQAIDDAIKKLLDNKLLTKLMSIKLIKMMHDDGTLQEQEVFYATILEALINGEKVDYPEKEQFLILHKSLVEVYNEINPIH